MASSSYIKDQDRDSEDLVASLNNCIGHASNPAVLYSVCYNSQGNYIMALWPWIVAVVRHTYCISAVHVRASRGSCFVSAVNFQSGGNLQ